MPKIRIDATTRKSYIKDVRPGRGTLLRRIPSTHVKAHMRGDKGAKGKSPESKKWFDPVSNLHKWDKDLPDKERRRRAAIGASDLTSARKLQALANVTTDKKTKMRAGEDAQYFFAKHRMPRT